MTYNNIIINNKGKQYRGGGGLVKESCICVHQQMGEN